MKLINFYSSLASSCLYVYSCKHINFPLAAVDVLLFCFLFDLKDSSLSSPPKKLNYYSLKILISRQRKIPLLFPPHDAFFLRFLIVKEKEKLPPDEMLIMRAGGI